MGVEQSNDLLQEQDEQEQLMENDTHQRLARRRLLTSGLVGGGILVAGISGFALWNYQRRTLKVIEQMNANISALAWSPDGHSIAVGDGSGAISVRKFNGQQVYSQQPTGNISGAALAWSPDGKYLVVGGDGNAHIWRTQTWQSLASYEFADSSFAWSPDGKWIASGGMYGLIQIWQPGNGYESYALQAYTGTDGALLTINSLAWSPDSTHVATVGSNPGDVIALWNAATGQAVPLPFNGHVENPVLNRMNAIGWSPDGMHIAAGYADGQKTGRVVLWSWQQQTKTWEYTSAAPAHFQAVNGIVWSPDSTRFASVGQDTKVQIWTISNGLQTDISASTKGFAESAALNALSWSPDGKYLLVGDNVGQVLLWEVD